MLYLDYARKEGEWIANKDGGNIIWKALEFLREFNTAVNKHYPNVKNASAERNRPPIQNLHMLEEKNKTMYNQLDIYHISVECYPVAKVGGLADVAGALPKYQNQLGAKAKVVMPWDRCSWKWLGSFPEFDQWKWGLLDWNKCINPLAVMIKSVHAFNAVSEGYLEELLAEANGLEELIRQENAKAYGIINGIDTEVWDPKADPMIDNNYTLKTSAKKRELNKVQLCEAYNLNPDLPLFAFIGRFAKEKGADALPDLISRLDTATDIGTIESFFEPNMDLPEFCPAVQYVQALHNLYAIQKLPPTKINAKHPNPREIYKDKLIKEGIVSDEVMKQMEIEFKKLLDENFDESKEIKKNTMDIFMAEDWKRFPFGSRGSVLNPVDTKFPLDKLKGFGKADLYTTYR
ncbi:hypothetical protein FQR65_LT17328 [Abscondita terminalis]|nr:hypothetical protein FQR65_LT17328 [Abscondita terminalis]